MIPVCPPAGPGLVTGFFSSKSESTLKFKQRSNYNLIEEKLSMIQFWGGSGRIFDFSYLGLKDIATVNLWLRTRRTITKKNFKSKGTLRQINRRRKLVDDLVMVINCLISELN